MSNSIFSALLITALAAVVIMGIYYRTSVQEGGWRCGVRVAVYALIVISAVVFVHHYALSRAMRDESRLMGIRERFSSIHGEAGALGGGVGRQHPVPADIFSEPASGSPASDIAQSSRGTGPKDLGAPGHTRLSNVSHSPPQSYSALEQGFTPLEIQDAVLHL